MATADDQDSTASKLRTQIRGAFQQARGSRSPVLTHLNADTTWLLSLPYPEHVSPPSNRSHYNILIDPWLDGPQEDVASWFSKQWHLIKSSVRTVADLNDILGDAEASSRQDRPESFIDAVAISHEFTDHCHRATLLELDRAVPVFATTKAAELIRSWNHFDTVVHMASFAKGTDWRTTSSKPLPSWIGISRLVTGSDALYYHSAVVIATQQSDGADGAANALIYTPHGVESSTLSTMVSASPPVKVVALLHGLHDVSLRWTKQLNLGAVNAVKAQRLLHAKYWVGTHDEQKPGSGLITPLLRRKVLTVQDAIAQVKAADKSKNEPGWEEGLNCIDLDNGQSLLLE
jgi:hypothetical protein